MTGLTELCYSHTDLEPLRAVVTRVKKMYMLLLNKGGRSKNIGDAAQMTEIQLDYHLLPLLHIAVGTRITGTLAVQIAARDIRMMARFHSMWRIQQALEGPHDQPENLIAPHARHVCLETILHRPIELDRPVGKDELEGLGIAHDYVIDVLLRRQSVLGEILGPAKVLEGGRWLLSCFLDEYRHILLRRLHRDPMVSAEFKERLVLLLRIECHSQRNRVGGHCDTFAGRLSLINFSIGWRVSIGHPGMNSRTIP